LGKKVFDLFIFSSFFIACCAVVMTLQTNELLSLSYNARDYCAFVFFSTIASYNFHWYLTPDAVDENSRAAWTRRHKTLHIVLMLAGLAGAGWFFFSLRHVWFWLSVPAVLTFLYSAPKVPFPPLAWLKKVAIGKTIFLSMVWLYVTTLAPIILGGTGWKPEYALFAIGRFFFIYAICILFDYRDRESDRKDGIRSMITYFSEKGINALFYGSTAVFFFTTAGLYYTGYSLWTVILLLIPGFILLMLYGTGKRNFSDYLYYFVLDGLMMLSSLFTLIN
jgi:4-hydroxybenzoate polyprenyltransferase